MAYNRRTYCSSRYFLKFCCLVGYTSEVTRDPEPLGATPTKIGAHCQWGTYCSLRNYGAADATLPLTSLVCSIFSFLRLDYVDTTNQRTHWNRPAWLVPSRSARRVQPVDTLMRRIRQESRTNVPQPPARPTVIPSSPTATAGVVDNPLPPNWETRITPDGKTCEKLLPIRR